MVPSVGCCHSLVIRCGRDDAAAGGTRRVIGERDQTSPAAAADGFDKTLTLAAAQILGVGRDVPQQSIVLEIEREYSGGGLGVQQAYVIRWRTTDQSPAS